MLLSAGEGASRLASPTGEVGKQRERVESARPKGDEARELDVLFDGQARKDAAVVGHEGDAEPRQSARVARRPQRRRKTIGLGARQARRRLVEQQHGRAGAQRHRDLERAAVAERKVLDAAAALLALEAGIGFGERDASAGLLAGEDQMLTDAEAGKQARRLEGAREPRGDAPKRMVVALAIRIERPEEVEAGIARAVKAVRKEKRCAVVDARLAEA